MSVRPSSSTRARRPKRSQYDYIPPAGLVVHVPVRPRRGSRKIRQPVETKQVPNLVATSVVRLRQDHQTPANIPPSCLQGQRLTLDWKATEELRHATSVVNKNQRNNNRPRTHWKYKRIPKKPKSFKTNNPKNLVAWLEDKCKSK